MMIPKNSRNRRKQMSPHDSNSSINHKASSNADVLMNNSASSKLSALPTITRSSNHSTADYSNSNDADSNRSWMELDFENAEGAVAGGKDKKPVSHIEVAQYLADDQESAYVAGSDKDDDNSSTTSNLSEDFSVENGKNSNNKGDAKGNDQNANPSRRNERNDDDSSVTSFASDSFADGIPFDDLLEESLMASNHNLKLPDRKDLVPPDLEEIIEVSSASVTKQPTSFRSGKTEETSCDVTKPSSEISKSSESKRLQRKMSPKPKQSKKKTSSNKKSPGAIQGRKRLQSTTNTNNRETGEGVVDNESKATQKRRSSKPMKHKSAPPSMRRRHPLAQSGDEDDTIEAARESEHKDGKKKATTKTKTASAVPSQRRQRLRSSDGEEVIIGNVEEEGKEQPSEGFSIGGSNRSLGGTGDAERKEERYKTKSKSSSGNTNSNSKSHRRKAPSRHGSGEIRRKKKEEADRSEKKEVRKRYKKKSNSASDNEMEDESERDYGTKARSNLREKKEKMRRKSNSSETKASKFDQSSDVKKRKKKKQPTEVKAITPEEEIMQIIPSLKPIPPEEETIPKPESTESEEEGDAELTYSFHFQSEGSRDGDDWLNANNSTSSSLSYNSFAQFSIDVTEMQRSGTFHNGTFHSGTFHVSQIDESCRSVTSNHSHEASVVFMAAKSKHSLPHANSFDGDNDSRCDDNTGTRSTRSCPAGSTDGVVKPEKQLRRRLKKSTERDGNQTRNDSNVEFKKKVRRTKSGGVERTKSDIVPGEVSASGKKRFIERTRSHNEGAAPRSTFTSKRRDSNDKSNRRKKEKASTLVHSKLKQVVRSKSAHIRSLSISPKKEFQKGKISLPDESDSCDLLPGDKVILLNDMTDDANAPDSSPAWRSPKRSPKGRQVHRTHSTPCPSHSMNVPEVITPSLRGRNPVDIDCSPMSTGFSPMLVEKKVRKPSPSRRALLSTEAESDEDDYQSDHNYTTSPGSLHKRRSLQRTPSTLLTAVRNFKHNSSNKMHGSSSKMLSKVKRTFSVSGRGSNTFKNSDFEGLEIGTSSTKGYVSRKERQRKLESESRRGQVKNSLYACMSDDDDSVDISTDSDESGHNYNNDTDHGSVSSIPIRAISLEKNKMTDQGDERPSRPRRVNSLPVGIRSRNLPA